MRMLILLLLYKGGRKPLLRNIPTLYARHDRMRHIKHPGIVGLGAGIDFYIKDRY